MADREATPIRNVLQPTGDQVRSFRDRQSGEPVFMLNLLKFRARADYGEGADADLTGREAYERYAEGFRRVMEPRGAQIVYSGEVRGVMIGEAEGAWDAVALIEYPSTQVMLDMLRDDEYQRVQLHRAAGLEGQLLIECGPGFSF